MRCPLRSSAVLWVLLEPLVVACYDGEPEAPAGGSEVTGLAGGAGGQGPGKPESIAGSGMTVTGESAATPVVLASDGWLDKSSNSLGLQGSLSGATGTSSTLALTADSTEFCLSGATAKVAALSSAEDGTVTAWDYTTYWGAAASLNLCQDSPSDPALVLGRCPSAPGVAANLAGVRFTVSGTLPRQLRVVFQEQGRDNSAYVAVSGAGEVQALIADAQVSGDAAAAPVDPNRLESIQFYAFPSRQSERAFDFCISDLEVLTGPAWGAPPAWLNEPGPGQKTELAGVNLSCAEFGETKLPGTYGTDYTYPTNSNLDFYAKAGMNVIRLPFRWERLQRTLGGELDGEELGRLDAVVDYAIGRGMSVILDPHNYARYSGAVVGEGVELAAFADFWRRLAELYANDARVIFGLMNEPHDMATETWLAAANAALAAIRGAGADNLVLVPGNGWTGGHSWASTSYGTPNSQVMSQVVDPAHHFAFELHQYLDSDSSGSNSACVNETIGSSRLANVTSWLRSGGYRAVLGEFGGADNNTCLGAINDLLTYLGDNGDVWMGWAVWAGGPWWGDYMLSVEPLANGEDRAQMTVLRRHLNAPDP